MARSVVSSVYATSHPHRILIDFRWDGVDVASLTKFIELDTPESPGDGEVDVVASSPISCVTGVENNTAWRAVDGTDDPRTDIEAHTVSDEGTDDSPDSGVSRNDHRGSDGDVCNAQGSTAKR